MEINHNGDKQVTCNSTMKVTIVEENTYFIM